MIRNSRIEGKAGISTNRQVYARDKRVLRSLSGQSLQIARVALANADAMQRPPRGALIRTVARTISRIVERGRGIKVSVNDAVCKMRISAAPMPHVPSIRHNAAVTSKDL